MSELRFPVAAVAALLSLSALSLRGAPPAMAKPEATKAGDISWASSYASALAKAKSSHRMVMVDFYTQWCFYCKKLDSETYPDPRVSAVLRSSFVPVRLDAEHNGASQAALFGIHSYPTLLFLDSSGQEEYRISGFLPADQFAHALGQINAIHHAVPGMEAKLAANPQDLNTAATLTAIYSQQNRTAKADATLKRVATLDPSNHLGKLGPCSIMVGRMYQSLGDLDRASSLYRSVLRMGKTGEAIGVAHLSLAFCAIMRNDVPSAVPELNAAVATPGAPEQLHQAASQVLARIRQQSASNP